MILKINFFNIALTVFAFVETAAAAEFKIFDAVIGYKDKPVSIQKGFQKLEIIYDSALWGPKPGSFIGVTWPPSEFSDADEKRIRGLARTWAQNKLDLVCLDIEVWPVRGNDDVVQASIGKFKKVISWIREEAPNLKIGIYGAPPVRDVYRAIQSPDSKAYQDWATENQKLKPLADQVDVIFPSLYTMTKDPETWKSFAMANLQQAAQYGKPVYAFVWPRYHDSMRGLAWTFLPESYWEMELQTVKGKADGIVIWDWGKGVSWDETNSWWKAVNTKFKK